MRTKDILIMLLLGTPLGLLIGYLPTLSIWQLSPIASLGISICLAVTLLCVALYVILDFRKENLMPQTFEAVEDESGKWIHPRWMVVDAETCKEVAGPFDTEIEAEDAAAEMTLCCRQGE